MEYRVEELARAAGVRVDTIRFYQARGLLGPPERRGRVAIYDADHLRRVRQIRELNRQGLSLEAIRRLTSQAGAAATDLGGSERPVTGGTEAEDPGAEGTGAGEPGTEHLAAAERGGGTSGSLLAAVEALEGQASYDRDELAEVTGFPVFLLDSLQDLGLLAPLTLDPEDPARADAPPPRGSVAGTSAPRYTEADREALEAAASVLRAGIPLGELLPLARDHAQSIESIAERAVELFEKHVSAPRDPITPGEADRDGSRAEAAAAAFRELLPRVTTLVALHFQRVLLQRAKARLRDSPGSALDQALDTTRPPRIRVSWR